MVTRRSVFSLCTNAESREWAVNCLINICHFRCCNNTLCLARPKNTKHRHLLNYLFFFMFYMISQLMLVAFVSVYHWCSHTMKTFIAPIKDYKKQCWHTIQGFQLHRVKVLPPIVPKCEGFYLYNSVSVFNVHLKSHFLWCTLNIIVSLLEVFYSSSSYYFIIN